MFEDTFGRKKMNKPKIIACGAKAFVGKDYFCDILREILTQKGFSVEKYSLATPLKSLCDEFLIKNFNVSAFSFDAESKTFIRDFLVTVGKMFRSKTKGKYFTNLLEEYRKLNNHLDYILVPDCRYSLYKEDELQYFQNENAYIIYLNRWLEDGTEVGFANKDEEENAPKILKGSTSVINWETFGFDSGKLEAAKIVDQELVKILPHFRL